MAEHKYTSLSDLIEDHQTPKLSRVESNQEIPLVTDMFGELYFRESSSSSPSSIGDLRFSPPLPALPNVPSDEKLNEGSEDEAVDHQNKMKILVKKPGKDSCMYNKSTRLFPPPISTLKMSRIGQTIFTYHKFDEKANAFVREDLKIHPQGVLAASRENGRLRMKFAHDGQEEEEEAMGAVGNDDGEQSDDEKI